MARVVLAVEGYQDDDSPLWPARCRGYLEGKRASDCLASVELAHLRAEKERLTELNDQFGLTIFDNRVELDHLYVDVAECKRLRAEWARASRRVGVLEKLLEAPRRHTSYRLDGKQVNKLLAAGLITAAQHKEIKAKTGHTAAKRIWRAGFETGLAAAALKGEP